jgi:hypothetical protein
MMRISIPAFTVLFFATQPAFAQTATAPTASDPQAVALASKAMAALTGGVAISDVTLTGTATRTAGSDVEEGSTTLKAKGTGESRVDLATSAGTRSDVRNSTSGPAGFWVGLDGTKHAMVGHNCLTDASWFFPALSILSQASSTGVIATYVGQETRETTSVQHLRLVSQLSSTPDAASPLAALSSEDIYLDSTSLLPVAILFNTHPDNDAAVNITVEIDFSNYQKLSGVLVPTKVQQLLNNGLFLDITIQSAAVNSGLSDAPFTD